MDLVKNFVKENESILEKYNTAVSYTHLNIYLMIC